MHGEFAHDIQTGCTECWYMIRSRSVLAPNGLEGASRDVTLSRRWQDRGRALGRG